MQGEIDNNGFQRIEWQVVWIDDWNLKNIEDARKMSSSNLALACPFEVTSERAPVRNCMYSLEPVRH